MNFYLSLGYLVLGSRLRRISELFLSEINRAYQQAGIEFEAGWFPVFYLLSQQDIITIKELSTQMEVSHTAASQLVATLKKKGLVLISTSAEGGRKQMVRLSEAGSKLLLQIKPIWQALQLSMEEMLNSEAGCKELLPSLTVLESALRVYPLADRITRNYKNLNPAADL